MTKQVENPQNDVAQLVYCVINYGRIVGCYANADDASEIQKQLIAKNQLADIVVRPLIYPSKI